MVNRVDHREYLPRRTFSGVCSEVKQLWFRRDIEPELLSGEQIPDGPDESDPMHERDARALADSLLQLCKPQEVRVLTMRFMEEMTLQEIGDVLGVTRERVRQIEAKAMRRIRHRSMSDKNVRSFFPDVATFCLLRNNSFTVNQPGVFNEPHTQHRTALQPWRLHSTGARPGRNPGTARHRHKLQRSR